MGRSSTPAGQSVLRVGEARLDVAELRLDVAELQLEVAELQLGVGDPLLLSGALSTIVAFQLTAARDRPLDQADSAFDAGAGPQRISRRVRDGSDRSLDPALPRLPMDASRLEIGDPPRDGPS
jgi:hypothetical protein